MNKLNSLILLLKNILLKVFVNMKHSFDYIGSLCFVIIIYFKINSKFTKIQIKLFGPFEYLNF
jgi:hypothetical protein